MTVSTSNLLSHYPELRAIYTEKTEEISKFSPIDKVDGGFSILTIFKKCQVKGSHQPEKRWFGKVGQVNTLFANDPHSTRTRTQKSIDYDAIREKIAYDLYHVLSQEDFKVPKSRLTTQNILDQFIRSNPLACAIAMQAGVQRSLRVMSCCLDGYKDLKYIRTKEGGGGEIFFYEFLKEYRRPPTTAFIEGKSVPIRGLISLIAVGCMLGDMDSLRGSITNAGFIPQKNEQGEVLGVQAVKIDPGYAFCLTQEGRALSVNWAINTEKKIGNPAAFLSDLRDIQTSCRNMETLIQWDYLLSSQKKEFLMSLFRSRNLFQQQEFLNALIYREGTFNKESEKISKTQAKDLKEQLLV